MKKISILVLLVLIIAGAILTYKSQSLETTNIAKNSFKYSDNNGNHIEAVFYETDIVEVHFLKGQNRPFQNFKAHIIPSASGSQYLSEDKQFSFWSKGKEATIFNKDDKIVFDGVLIE